MILTRDWMKILRLLILITQACNFTMLAYDLMQPATVLNTYRPITSRYGMRIECSLNGGGEYVYTFQNFRKLIFWKYFAF